jgi:hypothetical protein
MIKKYFARFAAALLLLFIALNSSAGEFWKENYPFNAQIYTEWEAKSGNFMVSVSDYATQSTRLTGILSQGGLPQIYRQLSSTGGSYSFSADTLIWNFTANDNFNAVNVYFHEWEDTEPSSSSDSFSAHKYAGHIVDLKPTDSGLDNGIVSGKVFIRKADASAAISLGIGLMDIHGRMVVYPAAISVSSYGQWHNFEVDISSLLNQETQGDIYNTSFYGKKYRESIPGAPVPLDFSNIAGIAFSCIPTSGSGGAEYTVKISDLVIGKGEESAVMTMPFYKGLLNKKFWDPSCDFSDWEAIADTSVVKIHSDSVIKVPGISISNFTNIKTGYHNSIYEIDSTGYSAQYEIAKNDLGQNWASQTLLFAEAALPAGISKPSLSDFFAKGFLVDMSQDKTISGRIKITLEKGSPATQPKLTIMPIDIHGRFMDNRLLEYPIDIEKQESWIDFTVGLNSIDSCDGSLYALHSFWEIAKWEDYPNGRETYPIDWENIMGFWYAIDFGYVNDDEAYTYKVEFADLVLGDKNAAVPFDKNQLGPVNFRAKKETSLDLEATELDIASIFIYKAPSGLPLQLDIEITPEIGFTLSGTTIKFNEAVKCIGNMKAEIKYSNQFNNFSGSTILNIINKNMYNEPFSLDVLYVQAGGSIDLSQYIADGCNTAFFTALDAGGQHTAVDVSGMELHFSAISDTWKGTEKHTIGILYNGAHIQNIDVYVAAAGQAGSDIPVARASEKTIYAAAGDTVFLSGGADGAESIDWRAEAAHLRPISDGLAAAVFSTPGSYQAVLFAENQAGISSDTVSFHILGIYADKNYICGSESAELMAYQPSGASFSWSTGSAEQSVTVAPTATTQYTLVTSIEGAEYSHSFTLLKSQPFTEELGLATAHPDNEHILVAWEKTAGKNIESYILTKQGAGRDFYDTIARMDFSQLSVFEDFNSKVEQQAYRYALVTVDKCGKRSPRSKVHQTVHLNVIKTTTGSASLSWTSYSPTDLYDTVFVYRLRNGVKSLLSEQPWDAERFNDINFQEGDKYQVGPSLLKPVRPLVLKTDSGPFSQSLSNLAEAIASVPAADSKPGIPSVYPNPATSTISLKGIAAEESSVILFIKNIYGITVAKFDGHPSLMQQLRLNLEPAIYFAEIIVGEAVYNQQLVVQ